MKLSDMKKRLKKDRPMTSITVRMPLDVVDSLKQLAPILEFTGYQPLLRYYVGKCLRKDLEKLEQPSNVALFVKSLKRHGVRDSVINEALSDVKKQASG